eukprot:scaffold109058_cov23-Tisochrysis_lutea.AAC.1
MGCCTYLNVDGRYLYPCTCCVCASRGTNRELSLRSSSKSRAAQNRLGVFGCTFGCGSDLNA